MRGGLGLLAALMISCAPASDYCERLAPAQEICGDAPAPDETEACVDSLKRCSEADLAVLDDYAGCLEQLVPDTCDPGFYDCAAGLVALSDPRCGA